MKKVTLLLVMFALTVNIAMAQSGEVQNAFTFNRQAQGSIELAENHKNSNRIEKANKEMKNARLLIQRAKTSIDNAVQHEKTMNDAKTWHYYGITYYKIAAYPEFNDLDPQALDKALEAFRKITEIDLEYCAENSGDIYQHIDGIAINYFNQGGQANDAGDYNKAVDCYRKAYDTKLIIGQQDNDALYNAAQVAFYNAKDYNVAIELCDMLINNSYENPNVYVFMAVAQGELNNNDKMLEYLQIGREKYPDNKELIDNHINAYIKLNREEEIIDQIKDMAKLYNEQVDYKYLLGNLYSNIESQIYSVDSAVNYYNQVIDLDPNHVDSYYNMGIMYYNIASELSKQAGELGFDDESLKKYDQMVAEAKQYNEKALPFIEKAYELLPSDNIIKQALKSVYARLKMTDKANALDSAQ